MLLFIRLLALFFSKSNNFKETVSENRRSSCQSCISYLITVFYRNLSKTLIIICMLKVFTALMNLQELSPDKTGKFILTERHAIVE